MPTLTLRSPLTPLLSTSLLLNATLWAAALWFASQHETAAVLHYSVDVGIDFIGEAHQIITLPAVGSAIIFGNLILGATIRRTDQKTSWILWGIIPIVQIILIAAYFLIWQANR